MSDAAPTSRRRTSLRAKLATSILLAGLLPLLAASGVAYVLARDSLTKSAESRLALVCEDKRLTVVEYFESSASTLRLVSVTPVVRESLVALTDAWGRLPEELEWPKPGAEGSDPAALRRREDAIHTLSQLHAETAGAGTGAASPSTMPTSPSATAAQVLFLSENPHPVGSKYLLERPARVATAYGTAHARIHPYLTTVVRESGFYDLFLVDAHSGEVVYSYAKEVDFGSNVREGPLAKTALSRAARRALEANAAQSVAAEDFELYAPSAGQPCAFLASPVRVEGKTIGAVVVQLPAAPLDKVLAREAHAIASTETYLVGPDRLMRSNSPFEAQSTFLRKSVDSEAAREALAGNTGSRRTDDYRGVDSLVAFTPVDALGLHFGMVRKLDAADALAPVRQLLYWMVGLTLGLALLALVAARYLSRSLALPIQKVTDRLQSTAQSLLSTAQQQQAGAAEAAAAVEETRQTFAGVLGAAQSLGKVGTEVLANAEVSQRNAQTIGRRIQELSGSTAHIGELLALVKEIANRSDLLALNAALEGTKAGEAGRGFSLVATQMQRLAEEVMGSVKKIEGLTQEISRSSSGAVLAAEEADKAATRTTTSAHGIAEAVQTQQTATEQVSVAMNEIATVSQSSVEAVRGIVASSNDLLGVADELHRVMGGRA